MGEESRESLGKPWEGLPLLACVPLSFGQPLPSSTDPRRAPLKQEGSRKSSISTLQKKCIGGHSLLLDNTACIGHSGSVRGCWPVQTRCALLIRTVPQRKGRAE